MGHGIAPLARGGELSIRGRLDGDRLRLDVIDDGVGFDPTAERARGDGHGLANVRKRLETYYEGRASLVIADNPAGRGTAIHIALPHEGNK